MHAAHSYTGSGSKLTKIAIVTALHVGLAIALLSLKVTVDNNKERAIDVVIDEPTKVIQPEIEKLDLSTKKLDTKTMVIPPPPIDVAEPSEPPVITKVVEHVGKPPAAGKGVEEGTGSAELPPVIARKESKFTAALANASDCIRPDYPASAARAGETGTVTLALLIGTDGKVSDAKVQRSSGSRALDRAAVSALSMCKFKPATANGVAEPAWGQIAYVWTLD